MLNEKRGFCGKFFQYVTLSMLSQAGVSLYVLADTYFIAQGLGTFGIASLNLLLPAFSLVNALGLMFGMGAATRYKIRVAEGRKKDADRAFSKAFFGAAMLSTVFVVLGAVIPEKISILLGGDENTLPYMVSYLTVIWAFAPLFMLNGVMVAVTRNDNRPGLAMGVMLLGSLANVVLDWVFIFPMGLGMFGAALATGIAPTLSIFILFIARLLKKNTYRFVNPFKRPKEYLELAGLGFSSFINEISNGVVVIVFNFILLSIAGNTGVAAYGIVTNIAWVVVALINGVAQGTQPLISSGYGLGDKKMCKKTYGAGLIFGIVLAIIVYVVIVLFADPIIGLFNSDGNVLLATIAKEGMFIYFIGMIPAAFVFLTAMFFNSTERPFSAIALSLSRGLVLIIPSALVLSNLFGLQGVWAAVPITEVITALIAGAMLVVMIKRTKRSTQTPENELPMFEKHVIVMANGIIAAPDARVIREEVFVNDQNKVGEFDGFDDVATHAVVRIGEVAVATARLIYEDSSFIIGRVAVLKKHRGKGYGSDIVRALEAEAKERGATEVRLFAVDNAVEFYRKLGYRVDTSGDNPTSSTLMKKLL